jgi:hypothetical protein
VHMWSYRSYCFSKANMYYLISREHVYDSTGNLLVEKVNTSMDETMRRKMSIAHTKFEDVFQMAKTSEEDMDILIQDLESLSLLFQPTSHTRQHEQENFIGMTIPNDVQVYPPSDICSRGRCKRISGHADKNKKKKNSGPRKCTSCKDVGHDRRNCPNKNVAAI